MTAAVASLSAQTRTLRPSDAVLAALAAGGLAVAAWRSADWIFAIAIALDMAMLWGIAWWDSRTLRAPNVAVGSALLVALAIALAIGMSAFFSALGGGAILFAVMLLIMLLGRGAMGAGDVKFAALAGVVVGVQGVLPVLFVAFITGGVVAAAALGLRLRKRKDPIAFTPFLAAGALAALAFYPLYLVT